MTLAELTGRARTHIQQVDDPRFAAHPEAIQAFMALREAGKKQGFLLQPISAFRDFEAQCRIWNLKYTGQRPLYSPQGDLLDFSKLTELELLEAILRWSALPGASRHHWGTEIDVIDSNAIPEGYRVQLLPAEVAPGGPFYAMHCWLEEVMEEYGFFRPYREDLGGVCPEYWHLSYFPISQPALEKLSLAVLQKTIQEVEIKGKQQILNHLDAIYHRYVLNIATPIHHSI